VVIVPNLIALVLLSPQVLAETRSYFERKPWRENEQKRQALKRERKL
jgi:Na+/alanine symporter